jgi:hypothetical protein
MCFGGNDSTPASTYNPYPTDTSYKGSKEGVENPAPKQEDQSTQQQSQQSAPSVKSTGINNPNM